MGCTQKTGATWLLLVRASSLIFQENEGSLASPEIHGRCKLFVMGDVVIY